MTEIGDRPGGRAENGAAGLDHRALPDDEARRAMIRRTAALPLQKRIALFEALSRDAAWVRSANRIR